jgi:hypothetical protein
MSIFPLIKNFQATSYNKAFILNAIVGAVICALAIELRLTLENDKTTYYDFWLSFYNEKKLSIVYKFLTTLLVTFIVSILVYYSMYFIFYYGGGQLSSSKFASVGISTFRDLFKKKINYKHL